MSKYLTYNDVAEMLGVSKKRVQGWVRTGELRPARLGLQTVRFRPEDIEKFVDSRIDNIRQGAGDANPSG